MVELFADRHRMPESMLPDVASLMFVTATSMIVTKWLEKNPARLLGHVGDGRGGGVESLVYLLIGVSRRSNIAGRYSIGNEAGYYTFYRRLQVLANVAACDLSLRVLWIPIQYFLRYLKDQQVLVR